jgi:hypothetical protein
VTPTTIGVRDRTHRWEAVVASGAGNSSSAGGSTRRDPGAPKGRPTPGRKQRQAAARARARRRRWLQRIWVGGLILLFVGGLVALVQLTT